MLNNLATQASPPWFLITVILVSMKCYLIVYVCVLKFYLSNLYTPCGARTHNPKIKSRSLFWLRQPPTPHCGLDLHFPND